MRPQKDRLPDPPGSLFPGVPLFRRVTPRGAFWLLALFLLGGVIAGSCASVGLGLFRGFRGVPLLFSGIPAAEQGFFPCFTTFLLHGLLYLGLLFLVGLSVLGPFGVRPSSFSRGWPRVSAPFPFWRGRALWDFAVPRSAICRLRPPSACCACPSACGPWPFPAAWPGPAVPPGRHPPAFPPMERTFWFFSAWRWRSLWQALWRQPFSRYFFICK